jgi:hypothetical protein
MSHCSLPYPPAGPALRRGSWRAVLFVLMTLLVTLAPQQAQAQNNLPLRITGVSIVNNQLVAAGTLGPQTFTAPITLGATPTADPTCPILNLELGPINLNLLGLVLETSPICLDITAERGPGNLLGNLLCSVAHLLDRGVPLSTILRNPVRTRALLAGVTQLLQGVFNAITGNSAVTATPDADGCPILHLALGPLDLNLLGLVVHLDDCNNGPVTVDLSAVAGPGNLLGNLLCSLAGLLDNPAAILQQIIAAILGL